MSNQLSMAKHTSIKTLHVSGHSNREIAKLLGIDRGTVNKYVARLASENRPNALLGSYSPSDLADVEHGEPSDSQNQPNALSGLDGGDQRIGKGRSGPRSACEPYQGAIVAKLDAGLSAKRIHQDLVRELGASLSYHCVVRFTRKLQAKTPLPFRRLETAPGEEAQVDFGTGAWILDEQGKKRRPWMFRIVLSHSRKAYSEVVWRQTTDNFITAIENAFHYFGGAPRRLVIDNLKAAVARADWYDPEVHPKLQSFAAHYGTTIVPTKPYRPEHKGKVESSVKYAKNNGLKGHEFTSLAEQNQHLLQWEATVADTRIHGTTKQQVGKRFEEVERSALLPLPPSRFAMFKEARRVVSRDGHIEVAAAYYSVPAEYITRRVWARWDARLVRIFNERWEQLAVHSRAEPGRFRTHSHHVPAEKVSAVERGTSALLRQVASIGPHTKAWSESMIAARGVEGVRVLVGLKALAGKYRYGDLEKACEVAVRHGAYRLRSLRNLIARGAEPEQGQFDFIDEHPIIRPLSDYSIASLTQFRRMREHEQ